MALFVGFVIVHALVRINILVLKHFVRYRPACSAVMAEFVSAMLKWSQIWSSLDPFLDI